MQERTYQFGKSKLTLKFGDITTCETDVIVSSVDQYLTMGDGVAAAILRVGGNEIAVDAAKKAPAKPGNVVITTAGRLKPKFIFHAITLGISSDDEEQPEPQAIVKSTTTKCLELLKIMNLKSISFPAIGTGMAGFSYEEVAVEMAGNISVFLSNETQEYQVLIYLFDKFPKMQRFDYISFFEAFASKAPMIAKKEVRETGTNLVKPPEIKDVLIETEQEVKAKRLLHLGKLLAKLEDQRYKLEEELINSLHKDENEYDNIKIKLKENEELRLARLKELSELRGGNGLKKLETSVLKVFLSSTLSDLVDYRKAIIEQVRKRQLIYIGMEDFGADPNNLPPAKLIVEKVKEADVYIGVFGVRYGYTDQATGLSMTELEYRAAKSTNKPMLLYVISETANIKVSDIEKDNIAKEKLQNLKNEIMANNVVYKFENLEKLERQVFEDLGKILK